MLGRFGDVMALACRLSLPTWTVETPCSAPHTSGGRYQRVGKWRTVSLNEHETWPRGPHTAWKHITPGNQRSVSFQTHLASFKDAPTRPRRHTRPSFEHIYGVPGPHHNPRGLAVEIVSDSPQAVALRSKVEHATVSLISRNRRNHSGVSPALAFAPQVRAGPFHSEMVRCLVSLAGLARRL